MRLKTLVAWLSPKAVDKPVTNLSHYPASYYNCWSDVKLTTNWPTFLQDNFKLPETVDEAVDRLMMVLDDEQKIDIATLQEDDLIYLHFNLGMAIRNAFGLHHADSKLLASCNTVIHPDDVSELIIKALWEQLTGAGNRL
jgi:hypothetical protein